MLVWLSVYICNWLAGWLAGWLAIYLSIYISICLSVCLSSSPDFLSMVIISHPSGTDIFTHKHIELLPPLIFVLKHICTRLTILTSSKLCSGQLAVSMHPLDCKYSILSFPKMLIALTTCMGRRERGAC